MFEMKRILFFEMSLSGHRLEYIHNLYEAAAKIKDEEFLFVLPHSFNDMKNRFKWTEAAQISFDLNDYYAKSDKGIIGLFESSIRLSKFLCKFVERYHPTDIFLISFMEFFPALPYLLPKGVMVSGIIYHIFMYDENKPNWLRSIINNYLYRLMAKSTKINKVMLLNDDTYPRYFNNKYKTLKFVRLSDPYSVIDYTFEDIRKEFGILSNQKFFVHFGGLCRRKGTMQILDAIPLLDDKNKYAFIFSGKIDGDISVDFYTKVRNLQKEGWHIFVKDNFVSYEFLGSICNCADCILMPYSNTAQSSGMLGFSSQYHKPVIGPSSGLIGYLIRKYDMGYMISDITSLSIAQAIMEFKPKYVHDEYININSVESFCNTILK